MSADQFSGLSHTEALVEEGTVGTIAALPTTYKSFLGTALACRIAAGTGELLGRFPVVKGGPVGYWWQDDSEANELRRLQGYARRHGFANVPIRWHLNEGLRLPDDIPALVAEIEREQQVFVVLDSL